MFLYNWPDDDDLYSGLKLVARLKTVLNNIFCVTGNIDIHYECYSNRDVPYKKKRCSFILANSYSLWHLPVININYA